MVTNMILPVHLVTCFQTTGCSARLAILDCYPDRAIRHDKGGFVIRVDGHPIIRPLVDAQQDPVRLDFDKDQLKEARMSKQTILNAYNKVVASKVAAPPRWEKDSG